MLFSSLLKISKAYHGKNAVIHNKRKITYGQLIVAIDKLAKELKEQGVNSSSNVAILSNNSIEYLIGFYSIAKLGAIAVPIDMRFKSNEIEKMFEMFDIEYCIYSEKTNMEILENIKNAVNDNFYYYVYEETVAGVTLGEGTPKEAELAELNAAELKEELEKITYKEQNKGDFLIQYTSGSTGVPKGIVHTQFSLSHINHNWSSTIGIKAEDEFLCTYVLTSAHATDIFILPALLSGATLHVMDIERVYPRFVANYIKSKEITVYTSLDYFFRLLNEDENITKEDFQSIKHVYSGSAPLTEDVGQTFYNKFGKYLGNIYGMAETGPSHVNLHTDEGIKFSSVGKTLNGMNAKVVDDSDQEVETGEVGEVLLKSDSMAYRYWNNDTETTKVFRSDGWVSTKDFGKKDENGNYFIVGRKSQFININGNKVSPDEVEDIINRYEKIKECAVIGVNKGYSDEKLVAFIVEKDESVSAADLNIFCGKYLAAYKLCKEYIRVDQLPRGENGKLQKKILEDHYLELQ